MNDLVALARKNPGKLNHAISSGGQYVLAELMKRGAGIDVVGVRYKGGTPAVQATVTGEVTYHIDQPGSFKAMIDAGRLHVLAVTGDRRSPLVPDAPTFAEAGLLGGDITSWVGLAGPKGMSPQQVEFINAAVRSALESPDVKQQLAALIATPMVMSVGQFDAFVRKEGEHYEKIIRQYDLSTDVRRARSLDRTHPSGLACKRFLGALPGRCSADRDAIAPSRVRPLRKWPPLFQPTRRSARAPAAGCPRGPINGFRSWCSHRASLTALVFVYGFMLVTGYMSLHRRR